MHARDPFINTIQQMMVDRWFPFVVSQAGADKRRDAGFALWLLLYYCMIEIS
jgi:hypothetical protein